MNTSDPSSMSLADIKRTNGELPNRLAYAGEHLRRKARKARDTYKLWKDTGCQFLMQHSEFRQQAKRNRIRRELGLEPIYIPGEGKPNLIH